MTISDLGAHVVIGGFILLMLWILTFFPVALAAEKRCLTLGYPSFTVDWTYRAYCIARVDQSDIVVPLATAPKR